MSESQWGCIPERWQSLYLCQGTERKPLCTERTVMFAQVGLRKEYYCQGCWATCMNEPQLAARLLGEDSVGDKRR